MGYALTRILVPIVILGVLALARKYLPAGPIQQVTPSREDLDVRFSGTVWIVNGAMLIIGIIFVIGTHTALVSMNRYLAQSNGPPDFLILPQSATWWFFPGFGALTCSWEITLQFWRLLGNRETASLYNSWQSVKTGFDSTKILRWMIVLIALPIGVLTALALPMHTALNEDRIIDCGYAFAPCKVYRYVDARRMTIIAGFRDRESH